MNKKAEGIGNIIFVVAILFLFIIVGLGLVFGNMVINWVFDEAVPEISTIGMVGDANLTSIADSTIVPANTFVQSFNWIIGVIYILALFGMIGLSMSFRMTGNKWLAGFFIACMLMLIIASIFISNIYQDFYDGNDDVGTRLHEQTLMSWLILYSPMVMCIIGFVCGIIMFTGDTEETTA